MKKDLVKFLVLTCVLTTMTVSTALANVTQSVSYQQQSDQISQQNEMLRQQNEYLMQQTEILKQQSDALKQSQAYNQGYMEGQGYNQRRNHSQLYTGLGLGYVMGQFCFPHYGCGYGWGRRCCH